MISTLGDQELIETFNKAVEMELEKEFISLLEDEIKRRGINIENRSIMVDVE
jgi:hypothetical protein